ncbi:UNVERIFIED_CONTAM: hypothetical protein JM85_1074 [Acetobacter peroxydans]
MPSGVQTGQGLAQPRDRAGLGKGLSLWEQAHCVYRWPVVPGHRVDMA